eukprot:tig00001001_g6217.t1
MGDRGGRGRGPKDEGLRSAFAAYGRTLDEHYDRRERIIKASRDITAESKKAIFLLHREGATAGSEQALRAVAAQIADRVASELRGNHYWRYARQFSPGLQEFLEASLFFVYLRDGRLATLEELNEKLASVQSELAETRRREREQAAMEGDASAPGAAPGPPEDDVPPFRVEISDYLLGVGDLTGELMRRAVNAVGMGDQETPFVVRDFMRSVSEGLKMMGAGAWRDKYASDKMEALSQSLEKVERTCYGIHVRGSEYPKEMLAAMLEGGGGGERGGGEETGAGAE